MDFISKEEFFKLPEKVQKVFLDYWKPEVGDLVYSDCFESNAIIIKEENFRYYYGIYIIKDNTNVHDDIKYDFTPLFTESQLRKFIEDKSGKIKFISITENDYVISTFTKDYSIDYAKDLLQAYWKVAIKIAEKEIEELKINEAMKQSFINNIHETITKEKTKESE